jgi:hypothetical protein
LTDRVPCVEPEEVGVLMDLLSHDMLNNNQATLSYLELIHSLKTDRQTREFAEKAASQVRTSSMLLDGMRRFITSSREGSLPSTAVDLRATLADVAQEVAEMFPHKRVAVDAAGIPAGTMARGGHCVTDLFMNLVMNLVQLDPGDDVRIEARDASQGGKGEATVRIEVAALGARLPRGVGNDLFVHARPKDMSKMARVSGAVFASSIARALGGTVELHAPDRRKAAGCAFVVSLKGAGRR